MIETYYSPSMSYNKTPITVKIVSTPEQARARAIEHAVTSKLFYKDKKTGEWKVRDYRHHKEEVYYDG